MILYNILYLPIPYIHIKLILVWLCKRCWLCAHACITHACMWYACTHTHTHKQEAIVISIYALMICGIGQVICIYTLHAQLAQSNYIPAPFSPHRRTTNYTIWSTKLWKSLLATQALYINLQEVGCLTRLLYTNSITMRQRPPIINCSHLVPLRHSWNPQRRASLSRWRRISPTLGAVQLAAYQWELLNIILNSACIDSKLSDSSRLFNEALFHSQGFKLICRTHG